jgi:hypothetical protein
MKIVPAEASFRIRPGSVTRSYDHTDIQAAAPRQSAAIRAMPLRQSILRELDGSTGYLFLPGVTDIAAASV